MGGIHGHDLGPQELDGIWPLEGRGGEDTGMPLPALPGIAGDAAGEGMVGDDPEVQAFVETLETRQIRVEELEGGASPRNVS